MCVSWRMGPILLDPNAQRAASMLHAGQLQGGGASFFPLVAAGY